MEVADALQYEFGMGPCLSVWTTGQIQRIDDTTADPRWAAWQGAAAEAGIRSVLSAPLVCRGRHSGSLKAHATAPGAFGEAEERLLGLLAAAAATLLGAAQAVDTPVRLAAPWEEALDSRELMGLAAGVLMARDHLTPRRPGRRWPRKQAPRTGAWPRLPPQWSTPRWATSRPTGCRPR